MNATAPKHSRTPASHTVSGGLVGALERGQTACSDCADRDSLNIATIAGATPVQWPDLGCEQCGRILNIPIQD